MNDNVVSEKELRKMLLESIRLMELVASGRDDLIPKARAAAAKVNAACELRAVK